MLSDNIILKVKENSNPLFGYDIVTGTFFENMIQEGIVDSYNTIKTAVEDAVSVASLLITTECIVVKEIDYDRKYINFIPLNIKQSHFISKFIIILLYDCLFSTRSPRIQKPDQIRSGISQKGKRRILYNN